MKPRICDIQFSKILDVLTPKRCPEEMLQRAQSLAKRGRSLSAPIKDSASLLRSLGCWVSGEGSSLFVVRVGPRAEAKAKEFAANVIDLLRPTPYGVIWSLSQLRSHNSTASMKDLLKSLIFQALRYDRSLLSNHLDQMNIAKFRADHTEPEWACLLSMIFSKLSKCFIVIETEDLFQTHRHDIEWARSFLRLFQGLVDHAESSGSMLKVLVVSYGTTLPELHSASTKQNRIVSSLRRPPPVPPRLRRPMTRTRGKRPGWQHLQPKF